jgi:hypothetical protein
LHTEGQNGQHKDGWQAYTNDARVINLLEEESHPRKWRQEPSDYELPHGYNQDRLVALVRDPQWIFTYWEITEERKQAHPGGDWVMRVFDHTAGDYREQVIDIEARNWYIETDRDGHVLQLAIGGQGPDGDYVPLLWSNKVITPPQGASPLVDERWLTIDEIYNLQYTDFGGGSSPEMNRAVNLEKEAHSAALINISSPLGGKEQPRDFRLQLNAELILYGTTEPGAQVEIQGQPVELGSDGTFSLRVAFDDGAFILPVVAKSPDGEQITITPVFTRETY